LTTLRNSCLLTLVYPIDTSNVENDTLTIELNSLDCELVGSDMMEIVENGALSTADMLALESCIDSRLIDDDVGFDLIASLVDEEALNEFDNNLDEIELKSIISHEVANKVSTTTNLITVSDENIISSEVYVGIIKALQTNSQDLVLHLLMDEQILESVAAMDLYNKELATCFNLFYDDADANRMSNIYGSCNDCLKLLCKIYIENNESTIGLNEKLIHSSQEFTALLSHSFDTNSISIVDQNVASYIFIRSLKRMLRSQIMLSAKASLPAR
jgi:hypothetical protein